MPGMHVGDPRPEYAADHALWETLLTIADAAGNPDVYGTLYGMRACGAAIEVQKNGSIRIVARLSEGRTEHDGEQMRDSVSGLLIYVTRDETQWSSELDWKRDVANYLRPHADAIKALVLRMPNSVSARIVDTPLPT